MVEDNGHNRQCNGYTIGREVRPNKGPHDILFSFPLYSHIIHICSCLHVTFRLAHHVTATKGSSVEEHVVAC